MIPGDKKTPYAVENGAIQVDGMAVEFNIDPVSTYEDWNRNITSVMNQLQKHLPEGHELVIDPVAHFDPAYFASLPDESKVLGCDPDFSAYTGEVNPRPDGNPPMRTASGHIHIGWTEGRDPNDPDHRADCIEVIKQLDYYIGIPSRYWDSDTERRLMYGKAGACRFKPYGVEYRTPSNVWLRNQVTRDFVFNAAHSAINNLFDGNAMRTRWGADARRWIDRNERITQDVIGTLEVYGPGIKGSLRNVQKLWRLQVYEEHRVAIWKHVAHSGSHYWRGYDLHNIADLPPITLKNFLKEVEGYGKPKVVAPAPAGLREAVERNQAQVAPPRPDRVEFRGVAVHNMNNVQLDEMERHFGLVGLPVNVVEEMRQRRVELNFEQQVVDMAGNDGNWAVFDNVEIER
jgi:hypothetical protein